MGKIIDRTRARERAKPPRMVSVLEGMTPEQIAEWLKENLKEPGPIINIEPEEEPGFHYDSMRVTIDGHAATVELRYQGEVTLNQTSKLRICGQPHKGIIRLDIAGFRGRITPNPV